jgi:aminopeptidase N
MKANHFDWGEIVCHEKAYAVVRMLADMMGPDRFLELLHTLQDRYRYRFLSFDDFQAAAETAAGRKLDWFFHDWVDTNGVAGYAIERVEAHDGRIPVRIRQTGTARFPVEVSLTTEDGVQSVQRIAPEPDTQTLDFAAAGQPAGVNIDPRGMCPLRKTGKENWTII